MTLSEAFGKVINDILKEKGQSKLQFAKTSGISRRNLHRIIAGETSPTLETIDLIAKSLKISPGKLILTASDLK
ncbi:MAG: helix-turn-helix transcriptional regulator [Calditrichaeota bacterium]|nr:helix-turn-helix transcriptional regulator [Calditrichota bacterium]